MVLATGGRKFCSINTSQNRLAYKVKPSIDDDSYGGYQKFLQSAPLELQDHWKALEEFRVFLDDLENEISRSNQSLSSGKDTKPKGLMRFFRRTT